MTVAVLTGQLVIAGFINNDVAFSLLVSTFPGFLGKKNCERQRRTEGLL
jgi:hypothetical protein